MIRRRWKWPVVASLALSLTGCAVPPGVDSGGAYTPTPPPDLSTMDCGSAAFNQAQAELAYPEKRHHRDAVYEACSSMSETQVDFLIQKTIGELAEHERNPG